jgi:tripartite ATP-independent transporter DctP family solute receptor
MKCLTIAALGVLGIGLTAPNGASAQAQQYSLAYDQPHASAYGVAADTFANKLSELSNGAIKINQYPGAQLGQEPQTLQKIRSGDIDFNLVATANAATIQPESGVFSLHFIFRDEAHAIKVLGDAAVGAAMRDMFASKVTGARMLALATQGLRNLYGKKEVHQIGDLKNVKVRVQATPTEDRLFPAYGAQVVHMPFGEVYTSLQTGAVDMAENGYTVFLLNKHYEVAPIMSVTEHEANNSVLFVSEKLWNSLTEQQRMWVQAAADEVSRTQPKVAFDLEHQSRAKLERLGVKIVDHVEKSGFETVSKPIQDEIAQQLGPNAVKILQLVRGTH